MEKKTKILLSNETKTYILVKYELTFNLVRCFEPLLSKIAKPRLVVAFRQHHDVGPFSCQQLRAGLYYLKSTLYHKH